MYRRIVSACSSSGTSRRVSGAAAPAPKAGPPEPSQQNVLQGFTELFRQDKRGHLRMHERLDWKAWNLFLALLPPAGLYFTMAYARRDMDDLVQRSGDPLGSATRASKRTAPGGAATTGGEKALLEKLEAIGSEVKDLRGRLERSEREGVALRSEVSRIQAASSPVSPSPQAVGAAADGKGTTTRGSNHSGKSDKLIIQA